MEHFFCNDLIIYEYIFLDTFLFLFHFLLGQQLVDMLPVNQD